MAQFDFIVIGAGSAGCVLANRLSENGRYSVLLIEAGGSDRHPVLQVPLAAGLAYFWKSFNWGYEIVPQRHMDNRTIPWPRGKVLGGSSSINGMMYMRGNRADYDQWAQMGLTGWSYDDVLPLFMKSEDHADRNDAFHGTGGPLRVVRAKADHPLYDAFLTAGMANGAAPNDDFNGADQEGLGRYDFNYRGGRRESSATAFLRPAQGRSNLTVWTKTNVNRLSLENGRIGSVVVSRNGGPDEVVTPNCEVILSAGAINTPLLLEQSGIGRPDVLEECGIACQRAALGVGENLQDHLGVYLTYRCNQPITLYSLFRPDRAIWAGLRAYLFGKGPASAVPLEAGGFLKTRPELDIPDIHITFVPGLNLETTQQGQGQHGYLINFYQLRPHSRGSVHITGSAGRGTPAIDPNYLAEESDRQCMRDGVRLAQAIGNTEPLHDYQADRLSPDRELEGDDEIDAWVRQGANTIFHPVGTCRMGADDASVVDPELKFRGIENLRIADASVMPTIIGGNTSAPTMMIAEKASQMILSAHEAG
ncbi:GMC family oxidoreductase [Hoeflea sp.]|uniref:GMC family oxidoreductase n=1 Tax=Hoeflea sp. TaxID=1940281 RepID=UPI003B02991A